LGYATAAGLGAPTSLLNLSPSQHRYATGLKFIIMYQNMYFKAGNSIFWVEMGDPVPTPYFLGALILVPLALAPPSFYRKI